MVIAPALSIARVSCVGFGVGMPTAAGSFERRLRGQRLQRGIHDLRHVYCRGRRSERCCLHLKIARQEQDSQQCAGAQPRSTRRLHQCPLHLFSDDAIMTTVPAGHASSADQGSVSDFVVQRGHAPTRDHAIGLCDGRQPACAGRPGCSVRRIAVHCERRGTRRSARGARR